MGDQRDDNSNVTVVIALQLLVAALAGLLLLEVRVNERTSSVSDSIDADSEELIHFHPELLARWDNEAAYARPHPCTRPRSRPSQASLRPDTTLAALRSETN